MPREWWYYRHDMGQATPANITIYHGPGVATSVENTNVGASTIHAVPYHTGRGGQIDGVVFDVNGIASLQYVVSAIYQKTSNSFPFPNQLLVDCGCFAMDASGVRVVTTSAKLPANEVVWFCVNANSASAGCKGLNSQDIPAIGGCTSALDTPLGMFTQSFGIATPWPSTFPSGTKTLTAADTTTFFVRVSS